MVQDLADFVTDKPIFVDANILKGVVVMTIVELIEDIHALNRELELYESKYGLLSSDFYELYINGELPDEEVDHIDEYGRWAAFYKIKLEREDLTQERGDRDGDRHYG